MLILLFTNTQVGLDELKNLAQEDIRGKLSTDTIVDETFSHLSSLYVS